MKKKSSTRRQLLATVSAIALMGSLQGADSAYADTDHPPLWLEFGWHYEDTSGLGDVFSPPFVSAIEQAGFISPVSVQRRMSYSYGGEGRISFQPDDSNWLFTAGFRYGRAHSHQLAHQQDQNDPVGFYLPTYPASIVTLTPIFVNFSNSNASNQETHFIADFQVGKDVGLGLLGSGAAQLNLGVRFAQLNSVSTARLDAIPDYYYKANVKYVRHHHRYSGVADNERSFQGIGPEVSWNGSAALMGDAENGEVACDWGANAAVLFGRQRSKVRDEAMGQYYRSKFALPSIVIPPFYRGKVSEYNHVISHSRSRRVIVPNLGGFAGLSFRYSDAKLSLGYRADFFFGAIDGGIDTRKSTTRGFFGPFASISIGLGD